MSFPDGMSVAEQADALRERTAALVYAHSIGAVPAVLAARAMRAGGLVLVEPALYDVARGRAAIERHIGIVTEARARADAGDLRGCWAILRPLMFGGPFDAERWEAERPLATRWATTNVPWGHGVRTTMITGIPTLIVTGGWNAEYETIAERLSEEGAEHVVLAGAQHRRQDLPEFTRIVADFERRVGVTSDQLAARSPTR